MAVRRYLAGIEPEKLTDTVLRLHEGSFATVGGDKFPPVTVHEVSDPIDIDMENVGVNGLDAGSPLYDNDYFPYLLIHDATGEVGACLSRSLTYGGVVCPVGWTVARKLPFGFCYRSAGSWAGIPDFHLSGASAKPTVWLTNAAGNASHRALLDGVSTVGSTVSLRAFMPDNARLASLWWRCKQGPGQLGSAYLYTPGPYAGPPLPSNCGGQRTIRTNSTRDVCFKTAGDVELSIWLEGYDMTEPS
jgi:hypothetical protein